MPKGRKKGKKGNKRIEKSVYQFDIEEKDILVAHVDNLPGGRHIDVTCNDSIQRKMFIKNSIRKCVWLNPGDILIVSLRPGLSDDNKCDFLHKFKPNEIKDFKKQGKLGFLSLLNKENEEDDIIFDDEKINVDTKYDDIIFDDDLNFDDI